MASKGKNLSKEEQFPVTNPEKVKIGIIVKELNRLYPTQIFQLKI